MQRLRLTVYAHLLYRSVQLTYTQAGARVDGQGRKSAVEWKESS